MARVIVYIALIVLFEFTQAQLLGGFNPVATEDREELIHKVNKLEHTGELTGAFLTAITCARSQVVAGSNYIVDGVFQQGSVQRSCIFELSEDLQDNLKVTSVDCATPISSC